MNILAFDTSTEYCSVALLFEGEITGDAKLADQRHSELLLPMIDALLKQRGAALNSLDGIAFGGGPGSFTGLRIACGVAQGLAFGAGLPVVGVSTLLALAVAADAPRVIACLDARMGEIYHAAYEKIDGQWQTLSEPGLYKAAHAPQLTGNAWIGRGSGFAAHGEALAARYRGQLARVDADSYPQASAIAELALPRFARGDGLDAAAAAPCYIRDKVAKTLNER